MATRVVATATIRAVKPGKFRPQRAAITLVSVLLFIMFCLMIVSWVDKHFFYHLKILI